MKSKLLIITTILSIGLMGCGNANNKSIGTNDTIEKTVAAKSENTTDTENNTKTVAAKSEDTTNKESNTKTVVVKSKNNNTENNTKTVAVHQTKQKENCINSNNNQEMSNYTNPRFEFSINYPKNFTLSETSTNNDGVKMTLGKASITATGYNNVLNDTAKSLYNEKLKNIKEQSIQEKIIQDNYFLISWTYKDMVYHTKTVVGKQSINSFTFSYPKNKRESYDSIAKQIENSFKTPAVDETH
ncbi:hypothetical protein C3495_14205 (plasmid) [Clostridiaceae bacterium 14S0207]|nr:hypothetical protein C3495_14205 [Clostridiaceae bacterium 14S0207]